MEKLEIDTSKIFEFFPKGLVALDLETTGLSPLLNRIVEVAGIKVTPSGIEKFSTLINPGIQMIPRNISIHKITNEMVKDSPSLKEVLPEFMAFVGELPLVAHNAHFDLGFIVYALHKLELPFPNNEVYCTVKLSRLIFKDFSSHRLGLLAEKLNIPLENAHRAENDAIVCLEVLLKSLLKASEKEIKGSFLFHLGDFKNIENFNLKEHLRPIQEKIENQEIIRIKYQGGSKKNEYRPIRPLSFLPLPSGHVLYAHCLESDLFKYYQLNKISGCSPPTEEDLKKYKNGKDL